MGNRKWRWELGGEDGDGDGRNIGVEVHMERERKMEELKKMEMVYVLFHIV